MTSAHPKTQQGKILLILDDTELITTIESHLSKYFEIAWAKDCQTGFTLAKVFQPNCILSDTHLPKRHLHKMLLQIRAVGDLATVGVVLLSGRRKERYQVSDSNHLVDLYISQPYLVEELIASLSGMTQMHRRCKINSCSDEILK